MRFVWFWSFWHWSTEGFRSGALLRSPLQGVASHWDEWYRSEASAVQRDEVDAVGRSIFEQRRFVTWLARRWAKEARWRDNNLSGRFVLAQLSRVAPFDKWTAFEKYRTTYGAPGIAAVVLDEESSGEPSDVRHVEAIALPLDEDAAAGAVVSDGFHADSGDLNSARRAAMSMLSGTGLIVFLALWMVSGARPYPRSLKVILAAGWVAVIALIARLLFGAEPGTQLVPLVAILFVLWSLLVLTAIVVTFRLAFNAWRTGRALITRIEHRQIRLRMSDGLSVQGGSAGLAFALNDLLAAYRSQPRVAARSWLWERFFRRLRLATHTWAATGIVAPDGVVEHVVLEPKIRACLRNAQITDVLTPWQADGKQRAIQKLAAVTRSAVRHKTSSPGLILGFASAPKKLRSHRCRHIAQSIIAIGGFNSWPQISANAIAFAVTVVMAFAFPDIRNVLQPPHAPKLVRPGSPSPYYLWVSLDTNRPSAFTAELESGFWSNRRVNVLAYGGADASVRAEMRLTRRSRQSTIDEQDGTVWITRRRKFLTREFESGDRVDSFPFTHVAAIRND